ncbi:Putative phosphatase [Klebsiella aerogenes EA1509E]|nr:Putative phosphatase [Klebsiella aerogenes EA1509E]
MTSRVIALDLDGTLLTSKKTILPASLDALARAREAGYQVIVVTGRHHVAIHPFYQALALDTPAICCNGTYLYDYHAKKVLEADPMPVDKALSLTNMLAEHDIHGLMYVDDAMLYERPTGHVIRTTNWAQSLPVEQRPVFTQVDSLAQAAREVQAVWKFALTDENIPKLQAFAQTVGQKLGLECEWSWHDQVDIARAGNSKGKRLAQWVAAQGLSMQDPAIAKASAWRSGSPRKDYPCRTLSLLAITTTTSACWKPPGPAWRWVTRLRKSKHGPTW